MRATFECGVRRSRPIGRGRLCVLGLACAAALSVVTAAAQSPAPSTTRSTSEPASQSTPQPTSQSTSSSTTQSAAQPPRFQSSVDVTSLDVAVVDDKGRPITDLTPADFTVRIDGNRRRVTTAEWTALDDKGGPAAATPATPDGYTTNEGSTNGRLIVIAVDQPNIRFGGAAAIITAANAFIDRLPASDRVAVAGFGVGAPATAFTGDRQRVKQAISRMTGQKTAQSFGMGQHNVSVSEALRIQQSDGATLEMVVGRECVSMRAVELEMCRSDVETEARQEARMASQDGDDTVQGLTALLTGLREIDAPKTLIFISEGFVSSDNSARIGELGVLAAAARTSLYALKLDTTLFDMGSGRASSNPYIDRQAQSEGLDMLAGAARGTLFTVTGSGTALFDRISSELSGYYLLGVESEPRDKDGKPHPIRVEVARKGALVRSRRLLVNASSDRLAPKTPRAATRAAMASPLLATALPMRIASFALQGPETDKVQLLIHADVGTDYAASKVVAVGYVITDRNGKVVDNKSGDMRLLPVMNGVPSPLLFTTGASLAPGDYTMKLAAAEGDRVGTVEHTIHAVLPRAGDMTTSELMVGGPLEVGELLVPTIGYQVSFGTVHGYVEAYGVTAGTLTAEYEIATAPDAPALLNVDVPPHPVNDTRVIFTRVMPINQLPPGRYVLRAILSVDGRSVTTLTRGFEISPPKVLMTAADGLGDTSVDGELYLPVDEVALSPPFVRSQALETETLDAFRERLDPSVKTAFDEGVVFLAAADYPRAEASFKRAIEPDVDSTPSLTYLAAAYAAAGHDHEAASAWQTALVDGTDFPEIYQWLGDAQLRNHDYGEARAILEEATGKWPSDLRFAKPLAILYGTFGRGREAVRTLERYLGSDPSDLDAYYLGVQWLFTVRSGGAVVRSRSDDRRLAHTWAEAYEKADGPQTALVRQWLDFLDQDKP
ncbi:MAG TPA: VWA domain-containing protein [Vicinamibacterales bacterium]